MNESEVAVLKSELEKKSAAFRDVQRLDKEIAKLAKGEHAPEIRKLRAQQNKIVNDTKDEILGDYQTYARDDALGNVSTLRRRAWKDRVVKNPNLLQETLTNENMATKDSIWGQYHTEKADFIAYSDNYAKMNDFEDPDLDLSDMSNAKVKEAIDHIRTYVDQKNLESLGEKYFIDDLEHVSNIDGDIMRKDMDGFINDVKAHTDNDKLLSMFHTQMKAADTGIIGFEGAATESAIGAARRAVEAKDLDSILADWKSKTESGTRSRISFSKLPFKSDDNFVEFIDKYSNSDPVTNYLKFTANTFLKSNVQNKVFGGRLHMISMPDEAFSNKFTKQRAEELSDMFIGNYENHSTQTMKVLSFLNGFKSIAVSSKALMLPLWSFADNGARVALEHIKNNGADFYRSYGKTFNGLLSGWTDSLDTHLGIAKGMTKAMFQKSQMQQFNKLYEAMTGFDEYNSVRILGEIENRNSSKILQTIDKFNKKFVYDPLHAADEALRYGAWKATTRTLRDYDPEKPIGLTERLSKIGIDNEDIKDIQEHIGDSDYAINIEDIKDARLRKKLRLLKYNTDMSAVPLDVTPLTIGKFTNAPARIFLTHFWSYHLKSTTQVWRTIQQQHGIVGKLNATAEYSLRAMPANLAINAMFTYLYTGENPFSDKYWKETVFGSLLGTVSRPAMVALSLATGDTTTLGAQVSNPMLSTLGSATRAIKNTAEWAFSDHYTSQQDARKNWLKVMDSILKVTPVGTPLDLGIKRTLG